MKKVTMSALLALTITMLVVTAVFADFTNGNFETGTFTSWTQEAFLNDQGLAGTAPFTGADIQRTTGAGEYLQSSIVGPFAARSQSDPYVSAIKYPGAGSYSAIVNGDDINYVSNTLKQTITVGAGDVDPVDSLIHVRFIYAPVFQQPNHAANLQPWFYVNLHNDTTNADLYDVFSYVADGNPLWTDNGNGWWYMDWISVDISGGISVGDQLTLEVIAADCALGGHAGYVYVDEISTKVPAPSISASAAASVTRGDNITYTFNYNSVLAVTGTVATATVPTGTTFVSSSLCTESLGLLTCNIGNIAAGGSGSFTVVVDTDGSSPDPVVLNTYSIVATGTNSSSGPAVNTALLAPPNAAPVADNDAYNTPMGTALNAATVLTGDTDADNDPLTAIKVTDPAHAASFTFNSDGTFAYTPANGFSGDDTFTYKANDGTADSNVATVTITVVNNAPTALTLSNRFIQEERPAGWLIGTLAGTDTDVTDSLTYSLANTVSCSGADNGYFAVDGANLEASATPIDYQTKYYLSICVRATDLAGLTFDLPVTVVVRSLHHFPMDMNGDGTDDYVVFRPSTGTWHLRNSPPIVAFGQNGDLPVGADYNGDGKSDIAVFRPAATGAWHIRGQATPINFGTAGDVPLPLDFNGDKKADIAVFRPSTSTWHIRGQLLTLAFGQSGDIPVPADYNGDGKADIAVFRPSTGSWMVQGQSSVSFGQLGDIPVPFDYNNDGKADMAVYHPATGTWHVRNIGIVTHGGFYDMPFPMFKNATTVNYVVLHAGPVVLEWQIFGLPTINFGANDDSHQ